MLPQFAYGEEGDDLETIERHCMELYNEINNLHLVQRGVTNVGDDEIQQIGAALSTDVLFQWLKLVDSFESSGTVNDAITHAWIAHPNLALRTRLDDGVYNSERNCAHTALASARQLVLDDPKYGEAWSLMAICYFDLEEYEAALEAAGKAVELIPQHYNMMCTQGIILLSKGQHDMAAQMLGKCLSLEPWSNAANYLSQALDLMKNK